MKMGWTNVCGHSFGSLCGHSFGWLHEGSLALKGQSSEKIPAAWDKNGDSGRHLPLWSWAPRRAPVAWRSLEGLQENRASGTLACRMSRQFLSAWAQTPGLQKGNFSG